MKLAVWLKVTGTTQEQFALASGVPQPLVSRYARGKTIPTALYLLAIRRATLGKVDLEDWFDAPETVPRNVRSMQPSDARVPKSTRTGR